MKYEKADNILPKDVIELIQQYMDGGYLYIPTKAENKKAWGENSGTKDSLKKRNREIFNRYNDGISIKQLNKEYYLTEHSIRRIIRQEKAVG
ncbi:CD3324 family protein [Oceanirhabdus sp. W0125-5]|uniref:CD3324 family protein n=1 Tax=Oceanirhabdus sp. W0125-5 TaxID=2999116 RepID=UPI0022F30CA4|nr:CD3324 family protein [Oceanirhabdus sp. W0125-5]WBW97031.1 CD3324 family protein [Oceanirhabdus sp. W0125-5]